jgi:hypothetical protein
VGSNKKDKPRRAKRENGGLGKMEGKEQGALGQSRRRDQSREGEETQSQDAEKTRERGTLGSVLCESRKDGKELNQEETKKEKEDPLRLLKESLSGSEGHLLEHPDEVKAILAGGRVTSVDVHTLLKGVREDDPSVTEEEKQSS